MSCWLPLKVSNPKCCFRASVRSRELIMGENAIEGEMFWGNKSEWISLYTTFCDNY